MSFSEFKVEKNTISIAITDLINSFYNAKEFLSLDIASDSKKVFEIENLDSNDTHKMFFNKYPLKDALYEFPVDYKFNYKDIFINLSGRADAFQKEEGILYELKVTQSFQNIDLFKMQLFLYAYILKKKKYNIKKLMLLIASTKEKVQNEFEYAYEHKKIYDKIKKLFAFLYDLYLFEISKNKNKNIEAVFPYPEKKPIQNDIISNIINSDRQITFIEAPFASGKTSAVLYALAKKYNFAQIHYFTSRNIQKKQVYDEGEKIGYKAIIRNSFVDTCKKNYSFCKKFDCNFYKYPFTKYSIFNKTGCPVIYDRLFYGVFDLIICDYNYLLFNALIKKKETICVIDEYHSFLNRLANFFSISITADEIKRLKEILFTKYKRLEKSYSVLFEMDEFLFQQDEMKTKGNHIDEIISPLDLNFLNSILLAIKQTILYIQDNINKDLREFESEIYPFFQKLNLIAELYSFQMVISYSKAKNEKIFTYRSMKFILEKILSGYSRVIGISATLEPKELLYHVHEKNNFEIYSQNQPKKLRVYISSKIETIYKKRLSNAFSIGKEINNILKIENIDKRLLNKSILIFFPSYEFIKIVEIFINGNDLDKILVTKNSGYSSNSLRIFDSEIEHIEPFFIKDKIHLLFFPYRSIIQEGANLSFDIAGGICVGIPFRVPDNQYLTQSILIEEYSQNSFEILSLFPALNDLLQSSGRIGRKDDADNFIYFIGKEYLNEKIYENILNFYFNVKLI